MAKVLFLKDSENAVGSVFRIAANDAEVANLNIVDTSLYTIKDISDADFNAVRLNEKEIVSYSGDTINTSSLDINFFYQSDLQRKIDVTVSLLDKALTDYPSNPNASKWTAYKNAITGINVSSLITDATSENTGETIDGYDRELADAGKYHYPPVGGNPLNMSLEKYVEDNISGVSAIHPLQLP